MKMPDTQCKTNPLEEYLKQNPTAYQNWTNIQEWLKQSPVLSNTVRNMTIWHRGLINNLLKPFRNLFEELLKRPSSFTDKKQFIEVKKKFIEAAKESIKYDDKARKAGGDDEVTKYLFWATTFLACAEGDFEMFKQEREKSYNLAVMILMKYTCSLLTVINNNIREEAGISEVFRKQTEVLVKWIEKVHPASIQAVWGL